MFKGWSLCLIGAMGWSMSLETARAEVGATQATVTLSASGTSAIFIDDPAPAQVVFTVRNDDSQPTPTSTLRLTWSTLSINGASGYPTLMAVNAAGGVVDLDNIDMGEVTVTLPPIAAGANRAVALTFQYPPGIVDASVHTISAQVTIAPGNTASTNHPWQLFGSQQLQVQTSADQATVLAGEPLSFTGRHRSTGSAITRRTYSVGTVPAGTRFQRAELAANRRLLCIAPPADQSLPADPGQFNASLIENNFIPGVATVAGWLCPQGEATTWIAVALDDLALTPPLFATGTDETWRMHLRHDDACATHALRNSAATANAIIESRLAILAEGLLPGVGNVATTMVRAQLFAEGFETDPVPPTPASCP